MWLVVSAVAVVVATASGAGAEAPATTARSGDPWAFVSDCDGIEHTSQDPTTVAGPTQPPRGAGSLALVAGGAEYREYSIPTVHSLSSLSSYQVSVRSSQSVVRILAGVQPAGGSNQFVRAAVPVQPNTWTTVDLSTVTFQRLTTASWWADVTDSGTLAHFATGTSPVAFRPVVVVFGCADSSDHGPTGTPETTYLDSVHVATSGGVDPADAVTDYEPPAAPTTTLTPQHSAVTITAGDTTALGAVLTYGSGWTVAGRPTTVQSATPGATDWTDVSTADSDATGTRTLDAAPVQSTSYRWTWPGDAWFAGSTSARTEVYVRTRVTNTLDSAVIRRRHSFVVRGTTYPAQPGSVVTLWRLTSRGPTRLTSAPVDATGGFVLTKRARSRGTWRLRVTVPATARNLAGTGPDLRVRVR